MISPDQTNGTVSDEGQTKYNAKRHKLIGAAADHLLDEAVAAKVAVLLDPVGKSTLEDVATWPDEIKGKNADDFEDQESKDFLTRFPNDASKPWHYVDLPVGVAGYDRIEYPEFTRDDDVVQKIGECVRILQGQEGEFSAINALRWLVHLVGDLHQPLHVACSYIDEENMEILTDPSEIRNRGLQENSDHGGNRLLFRREGRDSLHSYWDGTIPLQRGAPPQPTPHLPQRPSGDADQWAVGWAKDSIDCAVKAYTGIALAEKIGHSFLIDWDKAAYDALCTEPARNQIAMAGPRLALLVNTILA